MNNITAIVRNSNIAIFDYYRQGICFYKTKVEGEVYRFPVRVESVGHASLFAEMKCIHLMSQIKEALKEGTFVKMGEVIKAGSVIDENGKVIGKQG